MTYQYVMKNYTEDMLLNGRCIDEKDRLEIYKFMLSIYEHSIEEKSMVINNFKLTFNNKLVHKEVFITNGKCDRNLIIVGYCSILNIIRKIYPNANFVYLQNLIELYRFKPFNATAVYWFDPNDFNTRMTILKGIIDEMSALSY